MLKDGQDAERALALDKNVLEGEKAKLEILKTAWKPPYDRYLGKVHKVLEDGDTSADQLAEGRRAFQTSLAFMKFMEAYPETRKSE
jgi:CO dehydrogenase/acetyl-CoA synthase delta subunit